MRYVLPVRYAEDKEEATHRYPTAVYWGEGYFGDQMRYIVAESDAAALGFVILLDVGLEASNLQKRTPEGEWQFQAR